MSQEFQIFPKNADIWATASNLRRIAETAGVGTEVDNIIALMDKKERLIEEIPFNPPSARVWKSTATTVVTGTNTVFAFNTVKWDTTENSRMTRDMSLGRIYAPIRGVYEVGGAVEYSASATTPLASIRLNGVTLLDVDIRVSGQYVSSRTQWRAEANDYFELLINHFSGANRTVNASDPYSPYMYATWLRV